jgi:hypothetical protein
MGSFLELWFYTKAGAHNAFAGRIAHKRHPKRRVIQKMDTAAAYALCKTT